MCKNKTYHVVFHKCTTYFQNLKLKFRGYVKTAMCLMTDVKSSSTDHVTKRTTTITNDCSELKLKI